jgi:adenylate cyclase
MIFLADQDRQMLTAIASRGYDRQGVGAKVRWGSGVVGMAAAGSQTQRLSCVGRQLLYMNGVQTADLFSPDPRRRIPMPGLDAPQSLLAVPMIAGGEVQGLIFAESVDRLAFSPEAAQAVELIAAQIGAIVALFGTAAEPEPAGRATVDGPHAMRRSGTAVQVDHYAYADSIFINRDYVIKGVPGRLLWRMLRDHDRDGRTEFTNREFRLDASLKLPDFKDSLETRLLLLGRRLAENAWPIQIHRVGRGRLALSVEGALALTEHA